MPVPLPPKTPVEIAEKPLEGKLDRFRPEMPQIPGVGPNSSDSSRALARLNLPRLLQVAGVAAACIAIVVGLFWWLKSKPRPTTPVPGAVSSAPEQTAPEPVPSSAPPAAETPNFVATVDEVSKPWTAKKFRFARPYTNERINAMVIRLPGGELWAFALQDPSYGRCELEFVTDLARLSSQYGYPAAHPMVANPCGGTVYDPLKVGPLGGNTWARGEIVHGMGLRPPISIDVQVNGHSIMADRIE
jgi:hypothetical protein